MSFGFDDYSDDHSHVAANHGLDREQISENGSRMRTIISEFLEGDINIYQMKAALNILEKEDMDLV